MVRLDYLSKDEADKKDEILKKRESVKGLAKKIFGFWRVSDSVDEGCLVLKSSFNLGLTSDIGTINVKTDSMRLSKKSYQNKAENFADAYQERFMGDRKEFVITTTYSK